MKLFFVISVFILSSVSFHSSVLARRSYKKPINLNISLKMELNRLLNEANELHQVCADNKAVLIEARLKSLIGVIKDVKEKTKGTSGSKTHINKTLDQVQDQLETYLMVEPNSKQRKESLKEAFKQFVELAEVYNLDKYRIFFCSKDKSVWLQKSRSAKNPINPEKHLRCGRLVR
ncbi:hypothetical protein N9W41_01640 [bacterium]|nr:hypothetical protein [bacterium]